MVPLMILQEEGVGAKGLGGEVDLVRVVSAGCGVLWSFGVARPCWSYQPSAPLPLGFRHSRASFFSWLRCSARFTASSRYTAPARGSQRRAIPAVHQKPSVRSWCTWYRDMASSHASSQQGLGEHLGLARTRYDGEHLSTRLWVSCDQEKNPAHAVAGLRVHCLRA